MAPIRDSTIKARPMSFADSLESLLGLEGARAAGAWRVEGEELVLVRFLGAADLPAEVAEGFAAATRRVLLSATNLGIVCAAVGKSPWVAKIAEIAPDAGSGYWLRAFGATFSVAVPRYNRDREADGVIAVAIASSPEGEAGAIAGAIARIGELSGTGLA